jgi:hypothetical protein
MFPPDPNQPDRSPRTPHVTKDVDAPQFPAAKMSHDIYYVAWAIGFDAAAHHLNEDDYDYEAVDDLAHPEAFSYALDQIPEAEAPEISQAVRDGILAAYIRYQERSK